MKTTFLLFIVALIFPVITKAQVVLASDVVPGGTGSFITYKTVFKNKLIFASDANLKGKELWYYDDSITQNLFDLMPGATSGIYWYPTAVANGKLFFGGQTSPAIGYELYSWDGIAATPALVHDINPGAPHSAPHHLMSYNDIVYFSASAQLWMHNAITNVSKRLNNVMPGLAFHSPDNITELNGKIYFAANDNTGNTTWRKLYVYDPVSDTIMLAPNYESTIYADPFHLKVYNGKLYFAATSIMYGCELYVYDGVNVPVRITDINVGSGGSLYTGVNEPMPDCIAGYKGSLYFVARDPSKFKLYKYNPLVPISDTNPSMVYDINGNLNNLTQLIVYNDKLYFWGNDKVHGMELWSYDGINTPGMVADLNPGSASSSPKYYIIYNNKLFFTATSSTTGTELYKLDTNSLSILIGNSDNFNDLHVYPNPVSGVVHFEMDLKTNSTIIINLYDAIGREVYNSTNKFERGKVVVNANISQLAAGNYYYHITKQNGIAVASGKITKQ